jgi:hypothetical protein
LCGVAHQCPSESIHPTFHRTNWITLTAAYEAAWQHLRATGTTRDQPAVLKKNLAQIILASACKGEREVEALKDIALRALGWQQAAAPACSVNCDPVVVAENQQLSRLISAG